VTAFQRTLLLQKLFILLINQKVVSAGQQNIDSPVMVLPEMAGRLELSDVFNLVKFVVNQQGLNHTLGIEDGVESTQAASELLHHWYVLDLRTNVVPMIDNATVFTCYSKGFSPLILKFINHLWPPSLWVRGVAVGLQDNFFVSLTYTVQHVDHQPSEKVIRLFVRIVFIL